MELPCPLGDYKAQGDTEREAAEDLVAHLVKMHCRTPFPNITDLDTSLVDDVLSGTEAQARIKAGLANSEVEAKRH